MKSVVQKDIYAVVMAGGASSRLFPFNKVLSDITGSGRTMIEQAFERVTKPQGDASEAFLDKQHFYFVTGRDFKAPIQQQIPELPANNILIEPDRRNTLPAILWAMAHIRNQNEKGILTILTADHVIGDLPLFLDCLKQAAQLAQDKAAIVTLGICPSENPSEWTGFGAIETQPKTQSSGKDPATVVRFEEKPSQEQARKMIEKGGYFWNSGMFVSSILTLEKALKTYQPKMFKIYQSLFQSLKSSPKDAAKHFQNFPQKKEHPFEKGREVDNSIDFSIMVPLTHDASAFLESYVIPAQFSWVDVGSWDALSKVIAPDEDQNVVLGNVECRSVEHSILVAKPGKQLEVERVRNLILVSTENVTLALPLDKAQEVKRAYQAAQAAGPKQSQLELDCEGCQFQVESGQLVALGLKKLKIHCQDQKVSVCPC